ncbi:sodium channel protein Nach-like isoform X2 [Coccinella septempunctata]|uniref:sodium channel protein Nach-like isoform X2 n=1 Tax=Coccinella septempunctata TaxID=41139 RepID=UPI001D087629|nr:sodium channel protein Nach-like isoform X2 [Coccinella septempunctata]
MVDRPNFCRIRIFWAMVTFCSIGMAIYMTTLFWDRYTSNPTRTTVTTLHAPTIALPFPAVTLCNENIVVESKVRALVETLNYSNVSEDDLINCFLQLQALTNQDQVIWNVQDFQKLHLVLHRNNLTILDVISRVGQNCEEMLLNCQWNFMSVNCSEVFRNTYSKLGLCCTFYGNLRFNKKQTFTDNYGTEGTLSLVTNPKVEPNKYFLGAMGLRILFHDALSYPDFRALKKIITTGTQTQIQIFGTKIVCSSGMSKLALEQRGCVFPGEVTLRHFTTYSDANCLIEKQAYEMMDICGCVPFYYDFIDFPKCNTLQLACFIEASIRNESWLEYSDDCPASCEDTLYEVKTTQVKLEKGDFYYIHSGDYIENLEEHTTQLKIYFVKFQKILQRDLLFSTVSLIASFGGIYSLFMGCSLITICEIIYYCTLRLFVKKQISKRTMDSRK